MPIHRLCTAQKFIKPFRTNGQHQAQPDRPPKRITSTNPICKAKHPIRRNAECRRFILGRGKRHKLSCRRFHSFEHPVTRALGVCHRLDGGKGFRGHNHQCCGRVQPMQRVGQMGTINVRHKMAARPVMIRRQRQTRHCRPQIRASNTDIHHIGDRPTLPLIRP